MKKLHLGSSLVLFSAIAAGAATLTPENAEVVVVKGSPDVVKVAGRLPVAVVRRRGAGFGVAYGRARVGRARRQRAFQGGRIRPGAPPRPQEPHCRRTGTRRVRRRFRFPAVPFCALMDESLVIFYAEICYNGSTLKRKEFTKWHVLFPFRLTGKRFLSCRLLAARLPVSWGGLCAKC